MERDDQYTESQLSNVSKFVFEDIFDATSYSAPVDAISDSDSMEAEAQEEVFVHETVDGRISRWSAAAHRLFGYTASEIVGKSALTLSCYQRRDEAFVLEERLRRGGAVEEFCTVRVHRDGGLIPVLIDRQAIRDADQRISGYVEQMRDVRPCLTRNVVLGNPDFYEMATGLLTEEGLRAYAALRVDSRKPGRPKPALIVLKIANLSHYHSLFGRPFVERVRAMVGLSIKLTLKSTAKIAINDCDEVLVVLPSADTVVETIETLAAEMFPITRVDDTEVAIKMVPGSAVFDDKAFNFEAVLERARETLVLS